MNTTLELLRRDLAGHDAELTGLLCDRALRAPRVAHPTGWVGDLYAGMADGGPEQETVAPFVPRLERDYDARVLPSVEQSGASEASAVVVGACDAACVRALLQRLHVAARIAKSKALSQNDRLRKAIMAGDVAELNLLIAYPVVEQAVIERIRGYAAGFARDRNLPPERADRLVMALAAVYRDWLIPFSRDVQVAWLIAHPRIPRRRRKPAVKMKT